MKITFLVILNLIFINFNIDGQSMLKFEDDFVNLAQLGFPISGTRDLIKKYPQCFPNSLDNTNKNPLIFFSNSQVYKDNIDFLLTDSAYHTFNLGALMVVGAQDFSKVSVLRQRIEKSHYKDFYAALTFLSFQPAELKPYFQTLINLANTDAGEYLSIGFLNQSSKMLEKFIADNSATKNPIIRQLVIKSIGKKTELSIKDIHILKTSVLENNNESGWALSVLAKFKYSNLDLLVKPFLKNKKFKYICYLALANSLSFDDEQLIDSLILTQPADLDLLVALSKSNSTKSQKKWLSHIWHTSLPPDYIPTLTDTDLISNDEVYNEVCVAINNLKNPIVRWGLIPYFKVRNSSEAINYLLKRLTAIDLSPVERYGLVDALRGKKSILIKQKLPLLMIGSTIENLHLIDLLIEYQNYDFQNQVKNWILPNDLDSQSKKLLEKYLTVEKT